MPLCVDRVVWAVRGARVVCDTCIDRLLLVGCVLCTLGLAPSLGRASTTTESLVPDLLVQQWTVDDGLPLNHLTDLALGPDDSLWLSSYDGLVRFDGQRFETHRRASDPALPSNRFTDLALTPTGHLWAASEDGELVRLDGGFTVFGAAALPGRVSGLFVAGGGLWAASSGGLLRLDERPEPAVSTPLRLALNSVIVAPDGTTWLGSEEAQLYRVPPGGVAERVFASTDFGASVRVVLRDDDGAIWLGGDGLYRAEGERISAVHSGTPDVALSDVCAMIRRPDGQLEARDRNGWWRVLGGTATLVLKAPVPRCVVTSTDGARWPWRIAGGTVLRGDEPVYTSSRPIATLLEARDGSVWVATVGDGLVRLKPRLVHSVAPPAAWRRPSVEAVLADQRGGVWLGSIIEGLSRVEPPLDVSFATRRADGQPPGVLGLIERVDGAIEVGSDVRLCVVEGGTCRPDGAAVPWARGTAAVPLLVDHLGRTWYSGLGHWVAGLRALQVRDTRPGGVQWREIRDPSGAAIQDAVSATEGADGAVFVATAGAGLLRIRDDEVRRLDVSAGLSSNKLRGLYVDPRHVVWIGTEDGGLCRWVQATDAVACVGTDQGLFDDVVHAIAPDDAGRLWLSGNRGLSWVLRDTVEAVLDGHAATVLAVGLDQSDGMRDREANGVLPQRWARDTLGRLWFPTQGGAVWVQPRAVPLLVPPPVRLDAVSVGGHRVALWDGDPSTGASPQLALSADAGALTVAWSASAFDQAEDLRFRYRLIGIDDDWSPASRSATATWLALPPGRHVLQVQAGLGGVWGDTRLELPIERIPRFHETLWFPLSLFAAVALLGALLIYGWSRHQRRLRVALEARVAEQTAELQAANVELERKNAAAVRHAAHLAELNTFRQRFVADLSHELRTPLSLVVGPLQDLSANLTGTLAPADARRLDLARSNLARLEALSDQLLDTARLEGGELPLRMRRIELVAFVAAVVARFRDAFERRGLGLTLAQPAPPVLLYADRDMLDKIVTNLLGNALKFTERGGVTVAVDVLGDAQPEEGLARVSVADTGCGIEPRLHDELFERFYQVDRGDARRYDGVGIGLSLVRDLVTLQGGEVGLSSVVGVGSTFWFTLPLGVAHLELADIDVRPGDPPAGVIATWGAHAAAAEPRWTVPATDDAELLPEVLIVEDHPDMRAYLAQHLAQRFRVREASGGLEALGLIAQRRPHAVVSDVMMPGMDGLELCRRLRAERSTRGIPLVLVSAKASEEDRVAGLQVADDYMAKPVRPRELVARVARLVGARAHQRASSPELRAAPILSPVPPPTSAPEVHVPVADAGLADAGLADDGLGLADDGLGLGAVEAPILDAAGERRLARIDEAIRRGMADAAFGVIELAAAVAMSRRQFQREMRVLTGQSPSDYLRAARMRTAEALILAKARDTVAEVAADVGLSPAYFSRLYTVWHGRPPSQDLNK